MAADTSPNHATASEGIAGYLLAAAPLALAIGVFGIIFGAAASVHMDLTLVVAMSLLVFSGTLQFATVGLLASGAGAGAIVLLAIALNARHVVLGAVLRPRLGGSPLRRAVLAFFLSDESFGLAISAGRRAALVLLVCGGSFFVAWVAGTVLGMLGGRVVAVEGLAVAVFPVLFIGLTAVTVRDRGGALRAGVAAGLVLGGMLVLPEMSAFIPIFAALIVALPGGRA